MSVAPAPRPPVVPAGRPRPARGGSAYRGLPRPVRLAAWAALSVLLGVVLGATAPGALRGLGAAAALEPGRLAWYGVRAIGFLAYFAVAGSVIYGLLLSTKLLDAIAHRPVSFALHKDLALVGLALSGAHGLLLLADHTFAFTPVAIAVPFAAPYAPVAVGIGQLAFLLIAIVTGSFYVRRHIGQRAWRLVHYLTFLGFLGATAHGIAAGSDTSAPWAVWAYLVPVALVLFLFVYRIVVSVVAHGATGPAARTAAATPGTPVRPVPAVARAAGGFSASPSDAAAD